MGSGSSINKSSYLDNEFSFEDEDIADFNLVKSLSFNSKLDNQGASLVDEANLKTLKMIKPATLDVPFIKSSPFASYRMDKILMRGKFATLHIGRHVKDGTCVLIKEVMLSNLTKNEVTNLKYEMNVLSQLEHPSLVGLLAVHSPPVRGAHHTSKLYQVQEFLAGQKVLVALAQQESYCEQDILKIMTQLISAVQYLHIRGVVHYCINTDNLMFDAEYSCGYAQLKLINFSHCECESIPRKTRRVNPVTAFTAPELMGGGLKSGTVDSRADLYSVGVVMHVLLSGQRPTAHSLESRQFATVSPYAKNLLMRLLEADVTKRCSLEELLKHPWLSNKSLLKHHTAQQQQHYQSRQYGYTSNSQSTMTASAGDGSRSRLSAGRLSIIDETEDAAGTNYNTLNESTNAGMGKEKEDAERINGEGDLTRNLPLLREFINSS